MTDTEHFFFLYFNFLTGRFQQGISVHRKYFKKYLYVSYHKHNYRDHKRILNAQSPLSDIIYNAQLYIDENPGCNIELFNPTWFRTFEYFYSKDLDVILKFWYATTFKEIFFYNSQYEEWLAEAMNEFAKNRKSDISDLIAQTKPKTQTIKVSYIVGNDSLGHVSLFILKKLEEKLGKPNWINNAEIYYDSLTKYFGDQYDNNRIALDFSYQLFLYFKENGDKKWQKIFDPILVNGYIKHKKSLDYIFFQNH